IAKTPLVEKAEDDGVAVSFAQFGKCAINMRQRGFLKTVVVIVGTIHSRGLLFPMLAAGLAPLQVQRGKMNRAMQPTGDDRSPSKLTGLSSQCDKGRLRGFLRKMRISELPHRRRID